jgi:two-component system, NarL family, nitrate/nitrite response regulator NarL
MHDGFGQALDEGGVMYPAAVSQRTPVRVMLVSSLVLVRTGLRKLIDDWPGLTVVGEAANCADAIAAGGQIDIFLFDCDFCTVECFKPHTSTDACGSALPCEANCLDSLRQLLTVVKGARVILLTNGYNLALYRQALRLGVMGLVLKQESEEILIKAIRKVHGGELWLNQVLVMSLLDHTPATTRAKEADPEAARIAALTAREVEVVALIREGLKNKQIAERLFISEATVHHHLTTIYDKLGIAGRLKLLLFAQQYRLAELPSIPSRLIA